MTTPPAAAGTWWVMEASVVGHGAPQYRAVQSATRPHDTAVSHVAAGPFSTEADAQAWIKGQEGGGLSFPAPPNPLAFLGWLQEAGHYAGLLIAALTDVHLYISLGWLVLGFWLAVAGVVLWLLSTKTVHRLESGAAAAGALA